MGQALSHLDLRRTAGPVVSADGVSLEGARVISSGCNNVEEDVADSDSDWEDSGWDSDNCKEKVSCTEVIQATEPFASLRSEGLQKYRRRNKIELIVKKE